MDAFVNDGVIQRTQIPKEEIFWVHYNCLRVNVNRFRLLRFRVKHLSISRVKENLSKNRSVLSDTVRKDLKPKPGCEFVWVNIFGRLTNSRNFQRFRVVFVQKIVRDGFKVFVGNEGNQRIG